jgi:glucosamine--fructose-6-phosphate aminotransferase (isomerizing)
VTQADIRRSIEIMLGEIDTIPQVIAEQVNSLRPVIRALVDRIGAETDIRTTPPEVILTGCGDSYFAGLAARLAFEKFPRVRCRAIEALECSRYEVRYVPPSPTRPVLVAISYSGEVGRTIEATTTARRFGWRTVALTGGQDSRLTAIADESVRLKVPTLGFSPGTSTYVAMLSALYLLAAEFARARGNRDGAAALEHGLSLAPDLAKRTLNDSREPANEVAAVLMDSELTFFLGAGPSKATALFGAAKIFEGPQRHAVAQDLEEWAHEQYFVSGPRTPTVLVAPGGASRNRAIELIEEMAFVGVPSILVSDVVDDAAARAHRILPVAVGLDEALSPLLTCVPLALVAFFLAQRLGTRSYGFPSPEHEREHYETIHRASTAEPA